MSETMVHDSVFGLAIVGGIGGTVVAVAFSPWLGLVPSVVTLAIYAHRVWARRRDKSLREENERLRKLLEEKEH